MFERFTDRARQTILESQSEAIEQHLDFIGTEHLLLGLLRVGSGVAHEVLSAEGVEVEVVRDKVVARLAEIVDPDRALVSKADALAAIGIDLQTVKASVEASFGPGSLPEPGSMPKYTEPAKAALTTSLRRAQTLRHRHIGTEHVLLGLLDERDTMACLVLADVGVDLDALDRRVVELVAPAEVRVDDAWLAITQLHVRAAQLPEADRAAAAAALAELAAAHGRALDAEQTEVARLADATAATLEKALEAATTQLTILGLSLP